MVGLALGLLLIILLLGEPKPANRPPDTQATSQPANPDRLREYQERLRALQAQAAQESQSAGSASQQTGPMQHEPSTPPAPDPVAAERKRREQDSLFASNVVLSRRPEGQRPQTGARTVTSSFAESPVPAERTPSLDDIAEAVVRATASGTPTGSAQPNPSTPVSPLPPQSGTTMSQASARDKGATTDAISESGPRHRVLEGKVIEAVLTNRLDGGAAAPVDCLVTTPVYSHRGGHLLIPAGARILGETKPVQTFGETRLAVTFHRLVLPDGRTHSLDRFLGLNQIGDSGLRDRVNQHYWSTFGAAGAVGLISGLAQALATGGLRGGDGDRILIVAGGTADAAAQSTVQVMNRLLNRLPTVTIREGHRVAVYVTSDLDLPSYPSPVTSTTF